MNNNIIIQYVGATSAPVHQYMLFLRLDIIDKPIGGGVMSSGWFITPQLRLDYLG